jgi:hypothetical protein
MRPIILSVLVLTLLVLIITSIAELPFSPVAGNLVFGCLMFLGRVGRRLTVNWNGVLTATVCLALIYTGLHAFLRWLVAAMQAPSIPAEQSPRTWRWRWTSALLGVVVLMFVAGLSFIGIVHQLAWLATAKQPHLEERVVLNYLSSSEDQQHEIGIAVHNYWDTFKVPPPHASRDAGKHSWLTMSLPYMMILVERIDYKLDWNHPKNAPPFRRVVPLFLNPDIAPFRNAEGYALSHYAGNVHVLGNSAFKRAADSEKGSSNIVLAGEVASDFKAWGDPSNLRDPSTGFNHRSDGFGGPSGDGALMVMMDGSVKFFSKKTSPEVLSAISHPHVEASGQ